MLIEKLQSEKHWPELMGFRQKQGSLRHLRLLSGLVVAATPILLTGCVGVLPIPSFSTRPECGERITTARAAFVQPGKTTRDDVVFILGTNFVSLPRHRAMAYTWEIPGGSGLWIACSTMGGASGEFDWSHWRAFFIAFDDRGIVTGKAFKHLSSRRSLDEQLDRWLAKIETKQPKNVRD